MWVFGYGSLLWNPGFPVAERRLARLHDWHRSFCMSSIHHRGTPEAPGLVLALDASPGSYCDGLALKVAPGHEGTTLAYLRERELVSSAYEERHLPLRPHGPADADLTEIEALAYVIKPGHVQYCGGMTLEAQARIIARAHGLRGPNTDYLHNTTSHLEELGIADPDLAWLSARVRALTDDPAA